MMDAEFDERVAPALHNRRKCRDCKQVKHRREFGRDKRTCDMRVCADCRRSAHEKMNRSESGDDRRRLQRRSTLKYKYGITEEQYAAMLVSQDGKCAICLTVGEKLVVDHDHDTGVVRGLLCGMCNTAIGFMRDNPEILISAVGYLSRTKPLTSTVKDAYEKFFFRYNRRRDVPVFFPGMKVRLNPDCPLPQLGGQIGVR